MSDGKVIIDIDGNAAGFQNTLSSLGSIAKTAIGTALGEAITTSVRAATNAAVESVGVGIDYTAAMSEVQAISGATAEEYDRLAEKAREVGASTIFSASDAASALKYMAMAGWQTEDMLSGIDGIMDLAASSGEDLGLVSDIVTDALTAFGLEAKDSGHFADVLAAASAAANTNVDKMGDTFKYVAPLAGLLKYSVDDVAVAIGLMANNGTKAGMAGTALRSGLMRLVSPTDEAAKYMKDLGLYADGVSTAMVDANGEIRTFADTMGILREAFSGLGEAERLAYANEIFGMEASSGMIALIKSTEEEYNKLMERIYSADGAAESMSNIMVDNLKGDLAELESAWEEAQLTFFDHVDNPLRVGTQWVTEAVNDATAAFKEEGFSGLAEVVKEKARELVGNVKGQVADFFGISEENEGEGTEIGDAIGKWIGTGLDGLKSWVDENVTPEKLSDAGLAVIDNIEAAISTAIDEAGGLAGILETLLNTGEALTVTVGEVVIDVANWAIGEIADIDFQKVGESIGKRLYNVLEDYVEYKQIGLWPSSDDLSSSEEGGGFFNWFAKAIDNFSFGAALGARMNAEGVYDEIDPNAEIDKVAKMTSSAADSPMAGISEEFKEAGRKAGTVYIEGAKEGAEEASKDVDLTETVLAGASASEEELEEIRESGTSVGTEYGGGVSDGVSEGVVGASEAIEGVKSEAEGSLSYDSGYAIGKNFGSGLADGLSAGKAAVAGATNSLIAEVQGTAVRKMEIKSPSRWARREVGLMFSRGLGLGVTDGTPDVIAAEERMLSEMMAHAKNVVWEESTRLPGYGSAFFAEVRSVDKSASEVDLASEIRGLREDYRKGSVVVMDRQTVGRVVSKQQRSDERVFGK